MHFLWYSPRGAHFFPLPLGSTAEFVVFQPCLSFKFVAACLKHRSHYTKHSTALVLHKQQTVTFRGLALSGPRVIVVCYSSFFFFFLGNSFLPEPSDPRWAAACLHIYLFRFYFGRRAPCRGGNAGNAYCFTCLQTAPSDLPSLSVPWGNMHCNKFIIHIRMI